MFYAKKGNGILLIEYETICKCYWYYVQNLYLKRCANRGVFLKRLLANYDYLCDLNEFGFILGKIIQIGLI